jgi:hypothetical protein
VAENEETPTPTPEPVPEPPSPSRLRRSFGWLRRNAWLALVVGAVLVLTKAIDFRPPQQVRVGSTDVARIVGDAPRQEFSHELGNPQAVQVRATLRLYPDNEMIVSSPDPAMDAQGKLLSQPVVTTILGMNATIEQTVRLEDGDLEVDLTINATPRLDTQPRKGKTPPPIVLEAEARVKSRRHLWYRSRPAQRVNLDSRAFLDKIDEHGHRIVFTVEQHLFSLDLEVHRAFGTLDDTLASGS